MLIGSLYPNKEFIPLLLLISQVSEFIIQSQYAKPYYELIIKFRMLQGIIFNRSGLT